MLIPNFSLTGILNDRIITPISARRLFMDSNVNTECTQQRRARLMSMVVWQGQWVPVCDVAGNFVTHQCDNLSKNHYIEC